MIENGENEEQVDPLDLPVSRRTAKRSLVYCGLALGIVLGLLILAAGYQLWQANRDRAHLAAVAEQTRQLAVTTREQSAQTTASLCALRGNLERRVTGSEDYLKKHPEGIPGIASAGEIRRDIRNQRQTISTLSGLDC